jgi:MFS transporter, DHA3 family, macrolide efflux protein
MPVEHGWQKKTVLFLSSQTLSLFGSSLVQYALFWYVTLQTRSGLMMTLYIVCGFIPTFLLSPFAGVWADRYDRKRIIMLADAMIALVTLGLAAAFMLGGKSLWLVLLTAAIRALGTAVQGPAVGAIIPQFVPEDRRTRVNGIMGSLQAALGLVSPVVAGVLISLWPIQTVFLVDVVTAALAISVLLFFLEVPPHARAARAHATAYFTDMRLGFRYIRDHRYLVSFFLYMGCLLLLVAPGAFLTPLQVTRTYGSDVWRLTAVEVAFSGGMVLGGLLISAWPGFRNRMHTMLLSAFFMAVCTVLLGLAPAFPLYLGCMAVYGLSLPFFNTPSTVLIQEKVEEGYLGRVFSVLTMLMTSVMPLGMLVFGPLAEVVSIEWLLRGTGVAMVIPLVFALRDRKLMAAGVRSDPGGKVSTTNGAG